MTIALNHIVFVGIIIIGENNYNKHKHDRLEYMQFSLILFLYFKAFQSFFSTFKQFIPIHCLKMDLLLKTEQSCYTNNLKENN